jgi:phage baseplate assembly protein W
MRSYRNAFVSGGSLLSRRLDQLRSTLDSLGSRLRTAVSQAVGETVGVVVRDAVNSALDRVAGILPEPEPPRASSRSWNEDEEEDLMWSDDGWDEQHPEPSDRAPPDTGSTQRMTLSVTAGLSAAAWWLRRWTGRLALASTTAVGLIAGCTVFAAPMLANAGLRLMGTVGQVNFLSETVRSLNTT